MLTNGVLAATHLKLVLLLKMLKCVVKVVLNVVNSLILSNPTLNSDARPVRQVSSWTDSVIIVKLLSKMSVLNKVKLSE